MSDFTPDESQTLRVAMRLYMESMRTNAITFKDDPDMAHYFANEAGVAEALWNKMVQMDLQGIRAVRKALADAIEQDNRADYGFPVGEVTSHHANGQGEYLRDYKGNATHYWNTDRQKFVPMRSKDGI
jgi:hypothetical protein